MKSSSVEKLIQPLIERIEMLEKKVFVESSAEPVKESVETPEVPSDVS